jgi:hypothetical protein
MKIHGMKIPSEDATDELTVSREGIFRHNDFNAQEVRSGVSTCDIMPGCAILTLVFL